ncbi:MAG: PAS domain S-box protein [Candidatus Riflebacteria bacterium]|nr:PAS domain S-box protein [Candidatus Riflebacteria bacterium]
MVEKRKPTKFEKEQKRKITELQIRLAETEKTLRIIREGEVEVSKVSGSNGDLPLSLGGNDLIYRLIVETMQEAAFTVTVYGKILFCTAQFAQLLKFPLEEVLGHPLQEFVAGSSAASISSLLNDLQRQSLKQRLLFQARDGTVVPARVSAKILNQPDSWSICVVVNDLTELENSLELIQQLRKRQETYQSTKENLEAVEEALRTSEERFRLALKNSPVSLATQDCNLVFQWAYNQRTWRPDEIIGKTDSDLFSPEDVSELRQWKQKVLKDGNELQMKKWVTSNGRRLFLDIYFEPLRDSTGKIAGIGIATLNLTEQKMAEEALKVNEGQYRLLVETMLQGVVRQRNDGQIIEMNLAAERIMGKSHKELLNNNWVQEEPKPIREDGNPFFGTEHPFMVALRTGQPVHNVIMGIFNPKTDDYRWINIEAVPLLRPDQTNPSEVFIVFEDITERKRSYETLKESEERFRVIFEQAAIGVALLNSKTGQFVRINQKYCNFVGHSMQEMLKKTFMDITYQEDVQVNADNNRYLMEGKNREFSFEKRYVHKNGKIIWGNLTISPLWKAEEKPQTYFHIAIVEDITTRKRFEQELKELNESLEQRVAEQTAEVKQLASRLRALASELIQAEQRERRRLAAILHDHIQQLLVSAQMQLKRIVRADPEMVQSIALKISSVLDEALVTSRSLTVELFPPILHQSGLMAALFWLAKRMKNMHQFKVHICANNFIEPPKSEIRVFLFEAVRELLLNVLKHSGVLEAYLTIVSTKENLFSIIIEDKGKGFSFPSAKYTPTDGFGLFSLQQRLLHLGGTLNIESTPGQGMKVTLVIPIEPDFA